MPSENPIIGTGGVGNYEWFHANQTGLPSIATYQSGLPSAITSNALMYGTPDATTGTNAAGTSENVAMHVAILIAVALIGVFVFRQAGIRFAFAVGAGRG